MMCRRVKPFQVLKVRGEEALCMMSKEDDELEWVDVESIDIDDLTDNDKDDDDGFETIDNLENWVASPWHSVSFKKYF